MSRFIPDPQIQQLRAARAGQIASIPDKNLVNDFITVFAVLPSILLEESLSMGETTFPSVEFVFETVIDLGTATVVFEPPMTISVPTVEIITEAFPNLGTFDELVFSNPLIGFESNNDIGVGTGLLEPQILVSNRTSVA
jgi:hypothetical protein